MLEIARESSEETLIETVHLKGSLDLRSSFDFDRFFHKLIQNGQCFFVLELSHLEYVSGKGISSFMTLSSRLKSEGGKFACTGMTGEINQLFSFLGLDQELMIFPNLQEAFFCLKKYTHEWKDQLRKLPEIEAEPVLTRSSELKRDMKKKYEKTSHSTNTAVLTRKKATTINCEHCDMKLDIANHLGYYMCPGCGHQFQVHS